jgi:RNA polymerase sigma factor (TIGR02999 family)
MAERPTESDITRILHSWSKGDPDALEQLMPIVFEELKNIARQYMGKESKGHTLQPTALVNEVYLQLVGRRSVQWSNRAHFYGSSAQLMRRILVDHARSRRTAKRGGEVFRISLDEVHDIPQQKSVDLISLDDALKDLEKLDARQARIVEMRFFTGLSIEAVAEALGISATTVKREWLTARLWLLRELKASQ